MAASVTLPALLALYKIDRELHTLQVGLDNVQREQRRQQAKIAELTKNLEAQELAAKKMQADVAIRELDLKTRQQHIDKMRGTLNTTKTNKEYSAILVMISGEKSEFSKQENSLLELMQQFETATKANQEARQQLDTEKSVLTGIEAEHADKVAALQDQLVALKQRRQQAADVVPAEPLRQYDRISQKYPGDALAPVDYDENDMEAVSCGACYMGLNIEHVNALRGRDEVRRCNSCNRILYLREMLPAEPTPAH